MPETAPITPESKPLEAEFRAFHRHEAELKAKHGKGHVVIRGDEVLGVWPERLEALGEGLKAYGDISFLVHNINADQEPPGYFSRNLKFV